ncbi:MAG: fibrobacter succinogenes major paralogous domain-containing protein [Bacteroidales bacterium]|nr:fibrobacter succinogenes major paralogous domain-containing protein [Bacteroidales bacterium]MDD4501350.1 fibrobacter succinogenes major paralogous domain-containing protein [Bacteroidales bacterium]
MKKTIIFLFTLVFIYACTPQDAPNTFTDSRDGKVYKTVPIGEQVWMAENLVYLPAVSAPLSGSSTAPHYYVYGYDGTNVDEAKATANYTTYGVLYNWAAAVTACPEGWHLPSGEEWAELTDFLGGEDVAGGKMKETGSLHWGGLNTATNESGFTAFPGGLRHTDGISANMGGYAYFWSLSEYGLNLAWGLNLVFISTNVTYGAYMKGGGYSVRCLQD